MVGRERFRTVDCIDHERAMGHFLDMSHRICNVACAMMLETDHPKSVRTGFQYRTKVLYSGRSTLR